MSMKSRILAAALIAMVVIVCKIWFYSAGSPVSRDIVEIPSATARDDADAPSYADVGAEQGKPKPTITAASAQPRTLLERYDRSSNLRDLINALRADADAGNADAIRTIAIAYSECDAYFWSPELLDTAHIDSAFDEVDRPIALALQKTQRQRCADLIADAGANFMKIRDLAAARAEGLNDLFGQAEQLRFENSTKFSDKKAGMSDDDMNAIARKIALSGDPRAIAALAGLHSGSSGRGRSEVYAWLLVACHYGRDCSANSLSARRNCLQENECVGGDFRELLRRKYFSPDQFEAVQVREREILQAIASGDVSKVIP